MRVRTRGSELKGPFVAAVPAVPHYCQKGAAQRTSEARLIAAVPVLETVAVAIIIESHIVVAALFVVGPVGKMTYSFDFCISRAAKRNVVHAEVPLAPCESLVLSGLFEAGRVKVCFFAIVYEFNFLRLPVLEVTHFILSINAAATPCLPSEAPHSAGKKRKKKYLNFCASVASALKQHLQQFL